MSLTQSLHRATQRHLNRIAVHLGGRLRTFRTSATCALVCTARRLRRVFRAGAEARQEPTQCGALFMTIENAPSMQLRHHAFRG